MRGVNLDDIEPGRQRATRGLLEGIGHRRDLRRVQRTRNRIAARECIAGGTDRLPAARRWRHGGAIFPGRGGASLASRVRELHAGRTALSVHEPYDALEHLDVIVFPDAEIVRADAPFGCHRGRFGEHERRAAHRAAAEMNEMPVVGEAVDARVLAHRRDDDAVGKGEAFERERVEEVRHAPHSMVSIDSRRREAEAVGVEPA